MCCTSQGVDRNGLRGFRCRGTRVRRDAASHSTACRLIGRCRATRVRSEQDCGRLLRCQGRVLHSGAGRHTRRNLVPISVSTPVDVRESQLDVAESRVQGVDVSVDVHTCDFLSSGFDQVASEIRARATSQIGRRRSVAPDLGQGCGMDCPVPRSVERRRSALPDVCHDGGRIHGVVTRSSVLIGAHVVTGRSRRATVRLSLHCQRRWFDQPPIRRIRRSSAECPPRPAATSNPEQKTLLILGGCGP